MLDVVVDSPAARFIDAIALLRSHVPRFWKPARLAKSRYDDALDGCHHSEPWPPGPHRLSAGRAEAEMASIKATNNPNVENMAALGEPEAVLVG